MAIGAIFAFIIVFILWIILESYTQFVFDIQKIPYLMIFFACVGALVGHYVS